MSFLMDIPALIIIGLLIGYFYGKYKYTPWILGFVILVMFYYVSIGLFLGVHMFFGLIEYPTNFMYTSGFTDAVPFKTYAELCKYPLWYFFGVFLFICYAYYIFEMINIGKSLR